MKLAYLHIDCTTQSTCNGHLGEVQAAGLTGGPSLLLLPAGVGTLPRSVQGLGLEREGDQGPLPPACFCQISWSQSRHSLQCYVPQRWPTSQVWQGWGGSLPLCRVPSAYHCWGDLLLLVNQQAPPVTPRASSTTWVLMTSQSPMAARPPMGDRVLQSLNVALQQGGCHQHLMVGIPSYPQGLLIWLLLPAPKMVIGHLHSLLEIRPWVWSWCTS